MILPIKTTKTNVNKTFPNKGDNLIIKKNPAVNIVAVCIKPDTGVDLSMTSASQVCKPNCADSPITVTNNRNIPPSNKESTCVIEEQENKIRYSQDL